MSRMLLVFRALPSTLHRRFSCTTAGRSRSSGEADPSESLFRYTSGRWLFNEEDQLRRRYLTFNVDGLKQIAECTQNSRCVDVLKLQEGFNNKVYSMRFESGSEVIARLPTPIAGHPHWVVASEVATLDFVSPPSLSLRSLWLTSRTIAQERPRYTCSKSAQLEYAGPRTQPSRSGIHAHGACTW